ncbi:MAG: transposase [Nitrospirae bacterium RIFOXYB2_FULL_43_5]|nr:MAG: transposase [Nitrospirae bacterium GWF2_44_13]OGW64422.1 MAG: transposase [Nitrospirae bacterium RIFOXYA2_FULL_44_9]OGW72718.1 MAG: transposase [Nitrospirae bacterium RIFOXYC2_FULL_44_7]OGW76833.1 MAG: transposase [Nitrospirae bacterium RIFOXYB2_FULL_43_5]HBG92402.1 IS1 family transposase [Nitrospiraceae bacterium]
MNRLDIKKQAQIISALVEGNSIRATCRMTGAAKGTVLKLLADVGQACAEYQDKTLKNLPCKRVQCDEIWSFCYAKDKNVPEDKQGQFGYGDVWTFTALCADSKVVPTWRIGSRDLQTATEFMQDLAGRMKNRIQLTTDGHRVYLDAVDNAFGSNVDFSQLIKLYGNEVEREVRYSPAQCTGTRKVRIIGKPDPNYISTSYVERQNLTMRMTMRRFTRLTNAFSKKVENLAHAVALHFMHYNFCRIHQSLRVTPAMEAGITSHVWEIEEIISLINR